MAKPTVISLISLIDAFLLQIWSDWQAQMLRISPRLQALVCKCTVSTVTSSDIPQWRVTGMQNYCSNMQTCSLWNLKSIILKGVPDSLMSNFCTRSCLCPFKAKFFWCFFIGMVILKTMCTWPGIIGAEGMAGHHRGAALINFRKQAGPRSGTCLAWIFLSWTNFIGKLNQSSLKH